MDKSAEVIQKTKNYCLDLLMHSRCKSLPFHSIKHTLEVFENVETIGDFEGVNSEDIEILKIAALFHDTGISQDYVGHESISSNYANDYMGTLNYPNKAKVQILNCIKSTKMPQNPETLLECVICDADLFHLASSNYIFKNELLREEWKIYMDLMFSDEEWYQLNLDFLVNHKYYTDYGKNVLQEKKQKNIMLMDKLLAEAVKPFQK